MALHDTFESVRASLLHRMPLPTLEQAISELLSEETRLGIKTKALDSVLAISSSPVPDPALATTPARPCVYCQNRGLPYNHSFEHCPVRECLTCHKIAPGHFQSNCPKFSSSGTSSKKGSSKSSARSRGPRTTAATTDESSSSGPSFSMADVESIIQQVLAKTGTPSTALSAMSGTSSWYFDSGCCNHMTSDSTLFSSIASSSSIPTIHTADGTHMSVTHTGHISTSSISLSDVYHIPTLALNLVSVGQLCELGLIITFSASGCVVWTHRRNRFLG